MAGQRNLTPARQPTTTPRGAQRGQTSTAAKLQNNYNSNQSGGYTNTKTKRGQTITFNGCIQEEINSLMRTNILTNLEKEFNIKYPFYLINQIAVLTY